MNNILELMCREEGFLYLDHSDITTRHISKDGHHPDKYGIVILKINLLKCFFTFNPFQCDFYDEVLL